MYYKFNETNNLTGYIKELLHNFNLPSYKVLRNDLHPNEGRLYIDKNRLVKYEHGEFKTISDYTFNRKLFNGSTRFNITSSVYDIDTHNYFRRYLRFIRDYKGLDLMPLFNCFSGQQPSELQDNVLIKSTVENNTEMDYYFNINTYRDHNYYLVPINFDEDYTIAIDSFEPYELSAVIYTGESINGVSEDLIRETYTRVNGSNFNSPILFSTRINSDKYWKFEENLNLLIKLPKKVKTSIVVLEGNYLNNTSFCGVKTADYLYQKGNDNFITKLSLLKINDGVNHPFSDRMAEYILGNAITNLDKIGENIERVQNILYKNKTIKGLWGVWDDNIKKSILNVIQEPIRKNQAKIYIKGIHTLRGYPKIRFEDINDDLIGYVDKDVEYFMENRNGS